MSWTVEALAHDGMAELVVTDDGPGIPAEKLESVFDPSSVSRTSRSRETGGVGLGLTIARSIARAHGGDITLSNRGWRRAFSFIAIAARPIAGIGRTVVGQRPVAMNGRAPEEHV